MLQTFKLDLHIKDMIGKQNDQEPRVEAELNFEIFEFRQDKTRQRRHKAQDNSLNAPQTNLTKSFTKKLTKNL